MSIKISNICLAPINSTSSVKFNFKEKPKIDQIPWIEPLELLKKRESHRKRQREICFQTIITEIDYDKRDSIYNFIDSGVTIFYVRMRNGSPSENREIIKSIQDAIESYRKFNNSSIIITILVELTRRDFRTGLIARSNQQKILKIDSNFIITCDRTFCRCGSSKAIYINCHDYLHKLKIDDEFLIGNEIRLKVIKILKLSIQCVVITGGILMSNINVKFPFHFNENLPSTEEREDLLLATDNDIDFIVLPFIPLETYIDSIRIYLSDKENSIKLLTRVHGNQLKLWERNINQNLLLTEFDGVFIENITYSEQEKNLICSLFQQEKSIIIKQSHPIEYCGDENLKYFLYYPSGIVASSLDELNNIRGFDQYYNNEITRFITNPFLIKGAITSIQRTININICLRILSSPSKIRCVIITDDSGQSVRTLSHFRPFSTIIFVAKTKELAKELLLQRNVAAVSGPDLVEDTPNITWNEICLKRLLFGIKFGLERQIIHFNDFVLFNYKSERNIHTLDTIKLINVSSVIFNVDDIE